MAVQNDQAPVKLQDTSFGATPGLAEGLAKLEQVRNAPDLPKPTPLQMVKSYFGQARYLAEAALSQATVTLDNPSALMTAVPLVANLRINRALDTIASIPEGKGLVEVLSLSGVPVKMDNHFLREGAHLGTRSTANSDKGYQSKPVEIVVGAFSTHGRLVAHLAHELQHLNQEHNSMLTLASRKLVSPLEAIWYDAAIEADAEATAVDIAYKLKRAGKSDAWDEMKNGRVNRPEFSAAYEDAVKKNPAAADNGQAKRAAFDAWFTAKLGRGGLLADAYFAQGWSAYRRTEGALDSAITGNRKAEIGPLSKDDIRNLGKLSRVNYFDAPGGRPLDDPYYRRMPLVYAPAVKMLVEAHGRYQSKFFDYQEKMLQGMGLKPNKPEAEPQPKGMPLTPISEKSTIGASSLRPVDWEKLVEYKRQLDLTGLPPTAHKKAQLGMWGLNDPTKPVGPKAAGGAAGMAAPKPPGGAK